MTCLIWRYWDLRASPGVAGYGVYGISEQVVHLGSGMVDLAGSHVYGKVAFPNVSSIYDLLDKTSRQISKTNEETCNSSFFLFPCEDVVATVQISCL